MFATGISNDGDGVSALILYESERQDGPGLGSVRRHRKGPAQYAGLHLLREDVEPPHPNPRAECSTSLPLLTLVLTGRRRAEVIGLRAGDLSIEGETCFYSYRGKGGKRSAGTPPPCLRGHLREPR
jgi:integrase